MNPAITKLRVIIVDDSRLARDLLRGFLSSADDIEVVAEAGDGREALVLVEALKPDLITIDLNMPVMGGLEAIEELMSRFPLPILVVSNATDAEESYKAIQRGALDVVAKPVYNSIEVKEFVDKVRSLAKVRVISHMRLPRERAPWLGLGLSRLVMPRLATQRPVAELTAFTRVFAIACSTGGPRALAELLPRLPAHFPCPVLIAQHMSDGFVGGMVDWLVGLCKLPVKMVAAGELIRPGVVYVSPSEKNFVIDRAYRARLLERQASDLYHPSCDALLNSVADVFGRHAIGICLTGMGDDGAQGLARIRQRGGLTLAQDEASSFIFGMNRVAIESGAVMKVFSLREIGTEMLRLAEPASLMLEGMEQQ